MMRWALWTFSNSLSGLTYASNPHAKGGYLFEWVLASPFPDLSNDPTITLGALNTIQFARAGNYVIEWVSYGGQLSANNTHSDAAFEYVITTGTGVVVNGLPNGSNYITYSAQGPTGIATVVVQLYVTVTTLPFALLISPLDQPDAEPLNQWPVWNALDLSFATTGDLVTTTIEVYASP
jgi:hypothetical protein